MIVWIYLAVLLDNQFGPRYCGLQFAGRSAFEQVPKASDDRAVIRKKAVKTNIDT